jgi:undecaprenyl-diphosphatase
MTLLTRLRAAMRRHHVESYVLLLFLIGAAGLFIFIRLAAEIWEGESFAFDRWLLLALRTSADPTVPIGPDWLRRALIDITSLGGTPVLTLITIAGTAYLLVARKAATALFLVLAIAGGGIMSTLLKLLFARERPDLVHHLVEVTNASFPSGHAMNSAIVYLTLGALLARTEPSKAIRLYLIGLAIFLTLIIGFSRVYLGVHWPSDVAAGWSVGCAWAIICSLIARKLQRQQTLEPER